MSEISKPAGLNTRWAMSGDILDPGTSKYSEGWIVEIPPRQWFNFLDNRQDEAIAHINQHGIAVWDSVTEYQANKSYVQGSNGTVYRALTTNTNINPTTDGGTNWQGLALLPSATTAEAQAQTNDLSLISPLKLAQAFQGANQSTAANGFQKFPGGMIVQKGTATSNVSGTISITLPTSFTTTDYIVIGTSRDHAQGLMIATTPNTTGSFNVSARLHDNTLQTTTFNFIAMGF